MQKNYYVILGIATDANLDEIKAAFRRRAMELHPDRSGLESGPFQEIQEAYGVLSDPELRRRYDGRDRTSAARRRPRGPAAEPLVPPRPVAEPFRPITTASSFRDVSLSDTAAMHRPSFDELFDRWWSNFDGLRRPKAERLENLTVEVVISPDDARRGGRVRVWIPARATCPACGGHGAVAAYECWRCEGHGALTADYPVEVDHPPGLRDSHAIRVPLAHLGIENFYLTVLIRVSGEWS